MMVRICSSERGCSRKREFVVRRFLIASSNSTQRVVDELMPEDDCGIYAQADRGIYPVRAATAAKAGHAEKESRHRGRKPSPCRVLGKSGDCRRQDAPHHKEIEHMMHTAKPGAVDDTCLYQQPENEIHQEYRIGGREEFKMHNSKEESSEAIRDCISGPSSRT